MERTFARRLLVSSMVAAGAAGAVSSCTSADPPLPTDPNPIVVTNALPPPVSGGTVLVAGTTAIAADSDRDLIWVVDLGTQKVASIQLQKGDEPGRLIQDGAGRVHVALRGAGAVATIDAGFQGVTARTPVCSAPRGLAYDTNADSIHVACAGGELITLPAAGGAPTRTLRIADRDLRDVIVNPSGILSVTRMRSAEVLEIDTQGALLSRNTPVANSDPFGNSFTPTVAWRTLATNTGLVMVHQLSADQAVVISQPGGYGNSGDQNMTGCDTSIVHSTITMFNEAGTPNVTAAPITGATVPVDIAFDSSATTFVVASAGSDSLFFVDSVAINNGPSTPCLSQASAQGGAIQVGLPGQPIGVAVVPASLEPAERSGNTPFVAQIREIVRGDQGMGPALVLADQQGVFAQINLPGASMLNTGHSLFHHNASKSAFLACASCHPEGHEDGHTWQFDTEGMRRTQTVSGGVLETAPLHWNGDMGGLPDIMHEVFHNRMGGPDLGPQHIVPFADWLESIPAHPASPTGTQEEIAHGKQLFFDPQVGCDTCHNGAHFTNNQTVNVGTGQPFQVPTLIGVAARRPYMHDGCALTLADRFDPNQASCNGGSQHGNTAQLSQSDIADMIAYLETL